MGVGGQNLTKLSGAATTLGTFLSFCYVAGDVLCSEGVEEFTVN